jgi:hypothetical protein
MPFRAFRPTLPSLCYGRIVIDFHCHTLHSDGTDTPRQLALLGNQIGLHALCLTDHDTLGGIPEFLSMQPEVKTQLRVGTELSCQFLGRSLHVLGLLVNPGDSTFQNRLTNLRGRREDRNRKMLLRLTELGYPLSREEVQAQAGTPLLSRVHFAKALAAKGLIRRAPDAFERLIGDDCPGFVPREELNPAEAARWIREAGGVPVVAHPGRFAGGGFRWDEAMVELRDLGMEGLEGYYGEYRASEQRYFVTLAKRLDMIVTGGSDYHGQHKPGLRLGVGRGGLKVPDDCLDQLEARQRLGTYR